jgi:hypothetical protein
MAGALVMFMLSKTFALLLVSRILQGEADLPNPESKLLTILAIIAINRH